MLDNDYMRRCLHLARLGQGKTHPNPMVGCVVLNAEGQQVAEGFHAEYGGPHAEVVALDRAGEKARGGTLYVSLEPCNHTGQTPPCTEKILASGVKTVVCGMTDPNPKVAGSGVQQLREQGLTVYSGVLAAECHKLNEAFCHHIQTGLPFVVLKQAMTLDGKIATRNGKSQWITGSKTRCWVHQLRAESDAILSTAETVIHDNSQLTVRAVPLLGKPPVRVVLDRRGRLVPDKLALFHPTEQGGEIWVFTAKGNSDHPHIQQAKGLGALIFEVNETGQSLDLASVMQVLGQSGITQVLVEAGASLTGAMIQEGLVHKLWLTYGNQLLMDPAAKPGFLGNPVFRLDTAPTFRLTQHFAIEDNLVVEAYPHSDTL